MHYDPNYRNQFFYDSSNSIGIKEAFRIARRELNVAELKTKMPKSRQSKVTLFAFLGVSALILIITAIIWFVSKSLLLTLVLFVIMAFASVAVIAIVSAIAGAVLRRDCSDPVDAVCIGYSYSGGGSDGTSGGRMTRTPVFEYEYQGYKWVAFDGMYDNFTKVPLVSQPTKILVNPSDPEDIVWDFSNSRQVFLILAALFGSVLSIAMFLVVINDEKFMNAALSDGEPKTEAVSSQNPGSEIASEEEFTIQKTDDGRIILSDAYLRNEVFSAYPGCEYIVKMRKVAGMEVFDDGEIYAVTFEEDPDCSEKEWYFSREEATDEIKNLSAGDEYIYAEVKEVGAMWVFSPKEYAIEE